MPQISRARAVAYALLLLVALVFGGRFALGREAADAGSREAITETLPATSGSLETTGPPPRVLLVHVVGAVNEPGLYRLREGTRVADALRRAGGARPSAALELVNLAAPVADGQQILVPKRGESPSGSGATGSPVAPGGPVQKVHLNSATLEELDTLPGVGPVTAQAILDYRTEHGAFATVEELDAVSGIGPATLAQLTPLVDL